MGVVLTTVVLPATAAAVTPSEAVGFLSAQRVANGLPGLTESPAANVGCANHNAYMRQNGNALAHGETPGNPGYTPEGASTGGAEVLARGGSGAWDAAWANPWSDAPVHALLMFSPTYAQAGYADSDGFQCMRITTSVAAPGATYSVPGPGATGVPTAIDARGEGPYSPADVAGVDDANTGFNVIVYRPGTSVEIASATLVPAGGTAVDTRIVDNRTTVPGGGSWPWRGGVIVPVAPLSPATTYALDVTFVDGATHHADFTTAGAPAGGAGAGGAGGAGGVGGPGGAGTGTGGTTRRGTYVLRVAKASRRGAKLRLALTASGASVGRKATVRRERRVRTCTRAGRCTVRWRASGPRSTITLKRSQTLAVPRPARGVTMRLSVSVAAATVGDVRYPARTARRTYRR